MPLLIRTPWGTFWAHCGHFWHFLSKNTVFLDEKLSKMTIVCPKCATLLEEIWEASWFSFRSTNCWFWGTTITCLQIRLQEDAISWLWSTNFWFWDYEVLVSNNESFDEWYYQFVLQHNLPVMTCQLSE